VRGRLINPFKARIARLDTVTTAADPDGAGELESGYDPDFKETVYVPNPNGGAGITARTEHAPILIPCQVEVGTYDVQAMGAGGNDPDGRIVLVYHFELLELMGLVHAPTGQALLRPNDRLLSIHRYDDESLIQSFEPADAPVGGYFCVEAQPQSFGLSGGYRNLLLCSYVNKDRGPQGGG